MKSLPRPSKSEENEMRLTTKRTRNRYNTTRCNNDEHDEKNNLIHPQPKNTMRIR